MPNMWHDSPREPVLALILLRIRSRRGAQERYAQDISLARKAVFGFGEDSDTISVLAQVCILWYKLSARLIREITCTIYTLCPQTSNLAASQVVFLCVGLCTLPNCVSYVAVLLRMSKGISTKKSVILVSKG